MADNEPGRACSIPYFSRDFLRSSARLSRIGEGALGGKGTGLARIDSLLSRPDIQERLAPYEARIPRTVVLATGVFDSFVERNGLAQFATSSDPDPVVARAFQNAVLPPEILGDLRALIDGVRVPLAVRSSSLLEDSLSRPFAGVYATKMTPNNQADPDERFRKFVEAVKLVYASTYYLGAKAYGRSVARSLPSEKMAVVIQEVVGSRHGPRFYPRVSAVARSHDFYAAGAARPEEGVVSLGLGLGKTIVDGGACWTYSPAHPRVPPPYGSNRDLLRMSQSRFWAVNMGSPPVYDPLAEAEYLVQSSLQEAEYDRVIDDLASTYEASSDRIYLGVGREGPRVLDFGPLLRLGGSPFSTALRELVSACREYVDAQVELELACDWSDSRSAPLLGVVQVRPMLVADGDTSLSVDDLIDSTNILGASHAVGHGRLETADVVYVRPDTFDPRETVQIAEEVAGLNRDLVEKGRPYLLIGFGRWGTTDPWGGIPVRWEQVGGARAIVEVSLPSFRAAPSQGSHFFHNVTSLQVLYLGVSEPESERIDWSLLERGTEVARTDHVTHVRLDSPVRVEVDGRNGRGRVCPVDPEGGLPGADGSRTESADGND